MDDHDELISLILHGIQLAKQVETMLQSLGRFSHEQEMIGSKLDEIIRVFITARERLKNTHQTLYQKQQQQNPIRLHEEEYSYAKSMMGLLQTQLTMPHQVNPSSSSSSTHDYMAMAATGDVRDQAVAASSSSSSHMRLARRRKDEGDKRTMRVAAPRMGNTDIPPEDGFTWRKYGQKEILGSKFPRGYYRCTHQKLYQCPAKKQVQRLDDDPFTFEVTYRADHTCHMSSTAPSSAPPTSQPPPPPVVTHEMMAQTVVAHHHLRLPWLEFSLGGGGSGAGPSSGGVRHSKEVDQYLVADLADVMFNSGSSSGNTMDMIFTSTSMENKWDIGDHKKN